MIGSFYLNNLYWCYESGNTFVGVMGVIEAGANLVIEIPDSSFAFSPKCNPQGNRRRLEAEIKREIKKRFPKKK